MKILKLLCLLSLLSVLSLGQTTATPVISNIHYTTVAYPPSVTMIWDTDTGSSSLMGYDGDINWYQNLRTDTEQDTTCAGGSCGKTTNHSLTISGYGNVPLIPSKVYFSEVRSCGFTSGVVDHTKCGYGTLNFSFTTAAHPTVAGQFDYTMWWYGNYNIIQGYEGYYSLQNWETSVPSTNYADSTNITVTGLPSDSTLSYFYRSDVGHGTITYNNSQHTAATLNIITYATQPTSTGFKLQTASTTPVGGASCEANGGVTVGTNCRFTVNFSAASGFSPIVTRTWTWTITIKPVPVFPSATPASYPAIPCLTPTSTCPNAPAGADWEDWMVTYGQKWGGKTSGFGCADDFSSGVGNSVQFYDGIWGYWHIYEYDVRHNVTGNPSQWLPYIKNCGVNYRDWEVLCTPGATSHNNCQNGTTGGTTGYYVHAKGMNYDFIRTGNPRDLTGIAALGTGSANSKFTNSSIVPSRNRETAFYTETLLYWNKYTDQSANLALGVGLLLTQLDEIVTSDPGTILWNFQPYQIGLVCDTLFQYYDAGFRDPRILPACKAAADFMWQIGWIPVVANTRNTGMLFYIYAQYIYGNDPANHGNNDNEYRSLNQMYSFIYARLFMETGNARMATTYLDGAGDTYQEAADALWQNHFLGNPGNMESFVGKTLEQQLRTGFDFIKYRSAPGTLDNPLIPPRLAGGKGSPMIGKGSTQ